MPSNPVSSGIDESAIVADNGLLAPPSFRRWAIGAGLVAAGLGVLGLAANGRMMPPLVGAGLLCSGGALALFAAWPTDKHTRLLAMLAAVAVTMYAGAFLLQSATGGALDVEPWLGPVPLGSISPLLTGALFLVGVALLWLPFATAERPRGRTGAGVLGAAVAVAGLGILLAHGYGPSLLRNAAVPIPPLTGLALLILGIGLTAAAGPRQAPLSALSGSRVQAQLLARLGLAVVVAVGAHVGLSRLILWQVSGADAAWWSALTLAGLIGLAAAGTLVRAGEALDRQQAEQRRAAEAASVDHEMLQFVTTQLPLFVWRTDSDLRVISVLSGGSGQADARARRWMGRTIYELFRTRDAKYPPLAAHLKALQGETSQCKLIEQERAYDCRIGPWRDAAGAVAGCIGVSWSVTDKA